jgi:hypothetical protein
MPSAYATRASARARARLGQESTLNGAGCGFVHIEHGVRVFLDDVAHLRTVARIGAEFNPKVGDTLVHPDEGTVTLDALVLNTGPSRGFVIVST